MNINNKNIDYTKSLKNFLNNNYPNHNYIYGPNWCLVIPTIEEILEKDKNSYYHSKHEKECTLCHSKFKYGQSNQNICKLEKLIIQCNYCKEFYEYKFENNSGKSNNVIVDSILNNKIIIGFCCGSHRNMSRHSFGTCPHCHTEDVEIYNGRCHYCANEELNGSINCPIHGYQEKSFGGVCIICHNQTEEMREQARELGTSSKERWKDKKYKFKMMKAFSKRWDNMSDDNKEIVTQNLNHEEFCDSCKRITVHIGKFCTVCNPNKLNPYDNKIKFCPSCNCKTKYKYSEKTNKLECQVCNGNLIYDFYNNRYVSREIFESIEENKIIEREYMIILDKKGIEPTVNNVRRYKKLAKINNISFTYFVNSLVWCPHCERWETTSFNSRPNHWMFWTAETKQWMDDNHDKVSLAKKIIIGLDVLLNSSAITGVYGWFINDQISYIGESMDILTRSWNHIMYIFEEPDYWYDVVDYLDKNKIEVKILENVDKNDPKYKNMTSKEFKSQILKPLELKWINKLKPDSQRCDGTDHIRPINQRKIKINK